MANHSGFTLIELIVVIGITLVLSTLAISYNRTSDKQLVLFKDQSQVVGLLQRARVLTAERFLEDALSNQIICGFGIRINSASRDIILFQDLVDDTGRESCNSANHSYDSGEELETVSIDSRLEFFGIDPGGLEVVFTAPNLEVESNSGFPVNIGLRTLDQSIQSQVTISLSGQIDTVE